MLIQETSAFRINTSLFVSIFNFTIGFDGTSNVMAGMLYGVPIKGTHAHSFVSSFNASEESVIGQLQPCDETKPPQDFYPEVVKWLKELAPLLKVVESETNVGELVGFSAYAVAFPKKFLALVDTYNVLRFVHDVEMTYNYLLISCKCAREVLNKVNKKQISCIQNFV